MDSNLARLNQVLLHPDNRICANLDAWLSMKGGNGLMMALQDSSAIIPIIKEADLRGLGGSGFPAHVKWNKVAEYDEAHDKYLICNGNEDEPGTFKDRVLLQETPHQLIEGAIITALATGINHIIFYINPDLKNGITIMQQAIGQWKDHPLFKQVSEVLKRCLDMKVFPSSGHYIGGEETAAIGTVEGGFPFPSRKPPYPADNGVHGHPTLVSNIESICNVPHILSNGAQWFQDLGVGNASGTKLFSLSGDVLSPGLYELPMGISLNELINIYGGGMLMGKKFKTVFTGGPSNTLLTSKDLDVHLDFESVRERRSNLGTGAMIVVSEGTGIVKRVAEYVNFFAHSSCGQCPSCKTGTYYISMLLDKIDTGQGRRIDLEVLKNLCKILPGSGRCNLVDGSVKVLESSLYHFIEEYEQALLD